MLRSIDLKVAERLKDQEFRREWFRAELEDTVPEMFRNLREERNLTQSELASKAGMKQSGISRFERDREARWNFETLLKLAEALDAQLLIMLIKAEDVIASYERKEKEPISKTGSVLSASRENDFNKSKEIFVFSLKKTKHEEKKEEDGILGGGRWN